jgi:hypothetical protein
MKTNQEVLPNFVPPPTKVVGVGIFIVSNRRSALSGPVDDYGPFDHVRLKILQFRLEVSCVGYPEEEAFDSE